MCTSCGRTKISLSVGDGVMKDSFCDCSHMLNFSIDSVEAKGSVSSDTVRCVGKGHRCVWVAEAGHSLQGKLRRSVLLSLLGKNSSSRN